MNLVISLILDVLVVGIFVAAVAISASRGLVKGIAGLFGNILALIIAFTFSAQLGNYLNEQYLREPLRDWVVNQMTADPTSESTDVSDVDFDELFANTPQFFRDLTSYLGMDIQDLQQKYEESKKNGIEQAKSAVVEYMVNPLSGVVSRVIAFFLLYLLALLAVRILWWLSDLIAKIPIVRTFDKAGGALLGVVTGLLLVFVFTAILHFSSPYVLKEKSISERTEIYEGTILYRRVCEANPMASIFGRWFERDSTSGTTGKTEPSDATEPLPSDSTDPLPSDAQN